MPVIPVLARANRAFLVDAVGRWPPPGSASTWTSAPGCPPRRTSTRWPARRFPTPAWCTWTTTRWWSRTRRRSAACPAPPPSAPTCARPGAIFAAPEVEELIDFDQPCGLLMMSVLHFVGGDIAPLVAEYTGRLAPGSYLALSHVVTDGADPSGVTGVQEVYEASPTDPAIRSTAAIRELFAGFELPAARPHRRADVHRPDVRVLARGPGAGHLDALRARPQGVSRLRQYGGGAVGFSPAESVTGRPAVGRAGARRRVPGGGVAPTDRRQYVGGASADG